MGGSMSMGMMLTRAARPYDASGLIGFCYEQGLVGDRPVKLLQAGLMGLAFGTAVTVKEDQVFDIPHELGVRFSEGMGFLIVKRREVDLFPGRLIAGSFTRTVKMWIGVGHRSLN